VGCCDHLQVTASLARARADLEAGRAWKARDRLHGLLVDRQDVEVLDLLATVHYEMRDLPAAGALWFVTGRDDQMARDCLAAWRERHGNDEARWQSIPGPIRQRARSRHVRSLQRAAKEVAGTRWRAGDVSSLHTPTWWERCETAFFGAFVIWALAMMAVGMWTVFRWIAG
jgi:hypothetical protein